MTLRPAVLLPLLWLAAGCTRNIDEGQAIKEIAATEEKPAPAELPVAPTEQVRPDPQRALENYEKLLQLPQPPAERAETMRRLADLQLELDEQGGSSLEESDRRLNRAIELYTTVLKDRPDGPTNDRVLYQLARAWQSLGEFGHAEAALARLTREYPGSDYADDAHFRRAEVLFKLGQFDDASAEYRQVMALGSATPFFEPAQYKYGWSEYRQSRYESALATFLTILSRELPPGEISDLKVALEGVKAGKKDMTTDALRVVGLALTQMGGADAAARYFARHGEPPYAALVYSALGAHLLEKKRYTDSARSYETFVTAHPKHALAPEFLARAVAAQELGGFIEPVVAAKENYVRHFDPQAPYWAGRSPAPDVLASLRAHLEDLARYYQARGQRPREAGTAPARLDFEKAVRWYARLLELFPQDPKAAELRFLMAESLNEAGDQAAAAREYERVVAEHPGYDKAPDAAYAALLARQRVSENAPDAASGRDAALRASVDAALQLAARYPQHPQALPALTRASEDLYRLHEFDRAVQIADRVLKSSPPPTEALRVTAWQVTADAHFSQKRFAPAESGYAALLALLPPTHAERPALSERLASSIYKQGEAARDAGDARGAADAFLRVGRLVPAAGIRATADYDAATMLILLKDWPRAITVLEAFRAAHATSPLLPDVDKKLAVAYESAGRPKEAAAVLQRIAARTTETAGTRADAAWLGATLLDRAGDARAAAAAYEDYVRRNPQPLERAVEARARLADYAAARKDAAARERWLREIVAADRAAGDARTPRTQLLAAQAVLEFGRADARKAAQVPLKAPLRQSLPVKKQALERAIATLAEASGYAIAEVTTAATYELGVLYQDLARDLLASERPGKMSALEREQYNLLLEEQAFPFEEKAIEWHEANLKLAAQGPWTDWIGRSLEALEKLAPGRYARREQTVEPYAAAPPAAASAAGTRYAQAVELLKKNQLPEAEAALVAAVKDYPQFTGTYTNLGIVYARLDRKSEALVALNRAVALDPGNALAYNWLGVVAREGGDFKSAEQAYLKALAAAPESVPAQLNLAILYDVHLRQPAQALAAYRRYSDLTGNKDLRAAAWIAAIEAQLPAPATVQAPAATPVTAPATTPARPKAPAPPAGAPRTPKAEPARKTGASP